MRRWPWRRPDRRSGSRGVNRPGGRRVVAGPVPVVPVLSHPLSLALPSSGGAALRLCPGRSGRFRSIRDPRSRGCFMAPHDEIRWSGSEDRSNACGSDTLGRHPRVGGDPEPRRFKNGREALCFCLHRQRFWIPGAAEAAPGRQYRAGFHDPGSVRAVRPSDPQPSYPPTSSPGSSR